MELSRLRLLGWLDDALRIVSPRAPQHVHLDQLGAAGTLGGESLKLADQAYGLVLEHLGSRSTEVKAILFIPLLDAQVLASQPPSRDQLLGDLGEEPPSIYLLSREAEKFLHVREEYRVPYELDLAAARRTDVFTWYRVQRDEESYRQGWEYSRSIMLEHYPAALRFTT